MLWYFVSYGWQRFQLTRKSLTNLIRVCQSLLSNVLGMSKVHRYAFKQQCNLIDCILKLTFIWVANDQYNPEMLFMKTLTHGMGVFLCTFKWRRAFASIIGSQSSCCGVQTQEIYLNWKNELNQVRVESILLSSKILWASFKYKWPGVVQKDLSQFLALGLSKSSASATPWNFKN